MNELTYHQKYYLAKKEAMKQYYQDNKEAKIEYQKQYNKDHKPPPKPKGKLALKRERLNKQLKKNEKKAEEFRKLLNNNNIVL